MLRRVFFPAKPVAPAAPAEPEIMQVRVDREPPPHNLTMQEFAAQILENPAWEHVCERMRWDALNEIGTSGPNDAEFREERYRRLRAVDDVTARLGALAFPDKMPKRPRLTQAT